MSGLWRYNETTPEGKFMVYRRDGSVPEWPWLVLGAKDPAAAVAIRAYADDAERRGWDSEYVADCRQLAAHFENWQTLNGVGDPTKPPERVGDPATVERMRAARAAGGGSA